VNNAHAGIHPLRTTGIDHTIVSAAVAVMHATLKNKRDRRKSAVGVRPYSGIVRIYMLWRLDIGMMQQEKGVNLFYLLRRQRLANGHATHINLMRIQQTVYGSGFHSSVSPLTDSSA
jgi:hypothetical protein